SAPVCTRRRCTIPTSSSARAASAACRTTSCGSPPTRSSSSATSCGPTSRARRWRSRWPSSRSAGGASVDGEGRLMAGAPRTPAGMRGAGRTPPAPSGRSGRARPPRRRRRPRRERSELTSRVLVAIPALAVVLFLVIEGGLVFTLGVFLLGAVSMHELYGMYDRAHPVRLAGFLALAGLLLAAVYGNPFQVLVVARAALPVLFGLTLAQRHPSVGGMAVTLLGIYWIGFALAHAVLLRGLPHGTRIVPDVLVGVFLGDTAAYLGGRMFGRRPLAPAISPNKTVEGLAIGMVFAVLGVWIAGRYQD